MKREVLAVLVIMGVWLALSVSVQALGVAPADMEMIFEGGVEREVVIKVINSNGKEMQASIGVEGDMKEYIEMSEDSISFAEGEKEKKISYKIRFPSEIPEPGDHITRVIIREVPKEVESKGTGIMVVSAVGHILKVNVPYTGKYARAKLFVPKFRLKQENNFAIEVTNLGTETIDVKALLDIYGPDGEEVANLESGEATIESKDKEILIVKWTPEHMGEFMVKVRVRYNDHSARDEKYVTVGELFVDVESITVGSFVLGGIAKFDILLRSEWNREIKDLFARMIIRDVRNETVGDFKTPTVEIEAFERKILNAYWDTEGVERGAYDAAIKIYYEGKTTERKLRTYVTLENIETEIIGITARAIAPGVGRGVGLDENVILLIMVLLFSNLGWVWYFRRKGRHKG
jgi:hypothetical protein